MYSFSKISILNKDVIIELRIIMKKYVVESVIQFPTESIRAKLAHLQQIDSADGLCSI